MKIRGILLFITGLFFFYLPASAADVNDINWNKLNLTQYQATQINKLDDEWDLINSKIKPDLINNQKKLKVMLTDPNATECAIRNLYIEIILEQEHLKYQALEIFLAKRRLLKRDQLVKLHQMLK